jgi:hypothetical protein
LGQREQALLLLPEEVDELIRVHLGLVSGDGLRDHHLDNPDHAAPAYILALVGQSSIGEPDNLLEIIAEIDLRVNIIELAEEVGALPFFCER